MHDGLLLQFWENFRHNLFKPLLLFFYMGFSVPLLRVPFDFPHVIYQGLTIYLLVSIGWHGGEELAALDAHDLAQAGGFMVIGFCTNFIIGVAAYFLMRSSTNLRRIDAATVAGYYGSDSAGTFVTCVGVLLASGIAYAPYMPVMLAVMEIPGCLVALFLVSRLRQQGLDALGNAPDEPGYDANSTAAGRAPAEGEHGEHDKHGEHGASGGHHAAPGGGGGKSMLNWKLMHEVFLNPGLFLLFGGIVIGFVSELQRKHEDVAVLEVGVQGDVHSITVATDGEKLPALDDEERLDPPAEVLHASRSSEDPTHEAEIVAHATHEERSSIFVLPLQKAHDVAKKVEPKKKDPMSQLDLMYVDLFQGALCLFLLEMGMTACRRLRDLRSGGWQFIVFGVVAPNVFATFGMCVAHLYSWMLHEPFDQGTYVLFAVLCAAASYIAVPAVQRMAIPEASPTLPLAASLGLTFSYNVTIGIPTYIVISDLILHNFPVIAGA